MTGIRGEVQKQGTATTLPWPPHEGSVLDCLPPTVLVQYPVVLMSYMNVVASPVLEHVWENVILGSVPPLW